MNQFKIKQIPKMLDCINCSGCTKNCSNLQNSISFYFQYQEYNNKLSYLTSKLKYIDYQSFNLYLTEGRNNLFVLYPDLTNVNNISCDEEIIIEAICYLLGKLLKNRIGNSDLKKCYECLSTLDSARKIVDPNYSKCKKLFAAKTMFELINKYINI